MNKKIIILTVSVIAILLLAVFTGVIIFQRSGISHKIGSMELSVAKDLFFRNGIDVSNLEIDRYTKDEYGNTHIFVYPFYFGLRDMTGDTGYHFDSTGKLYFVLPDDKIDVSQIIRNIKIKHTGDAGIQPEPKLSLYEASAIAKSIYPDFQIYSGELGFYNMNSGISYAEKNYTLAWEIKPVFGEYPITYVDAYAGRVLYSFDGIIIN